MVSLLQLEFIIVNNFAAVNGNRCSWRIGRYAVWFGNYDRKNSSRAAGSLMTLKRKSQGINFRIARGEVVFLDKGKIRLRRNPKRKSRAIKNNKFSFSSDEFMPKRRGFDPEFIDEGSVAVATNSIAIRSEHV